MQNLNDWHTCHLLQGQLITHFRKTWVNISPLILNWDVYVYLDFTNFLSMNKCNVFLKGPPHKEIMLSCPHVSLFPIRGIPILNVIQVTFLWKWSKSLSLLKCSTGKRTQPSSYAKLQFIYSMGRNVNQVPSLFSTESNVKLQTSKGYHTWCCILSTAASAILSVALCKCQTL